MLALATRAEVPAARGQGVAPAGEGVAERLEVDEAAVVPGFGARELGQRPVTVDWDDPDPGVAQLRRLAAAAVLVVDQGVDEAAPVAGRRRAHRQAREVEAEVEADDG